MTEWYFQGTDGERAGPVNHDAFQKLQAEGKLTDATLVWKAGMETWVPLGTIPDRNAASASPAGSSPAVQSTLAATSFANCSVCNEQWPVNLLQGPETKRICGNCIRKEGAKPKKASRNSGAGVDYGWGRWFLKILVLTVLIMMVYGVKGYLRYMKVKGRRATEQPGWDTRSQRLPQTP